MAPKIRPLWQLGIFGSMLGALGGCSSSSSSDETRAPTKPVVNLVTDANRDGLLALTEEDETGEESWTAATGAIFLVNVDDDDGDGKADNADAVVNGPDDELDLARFAIAAWPDAPKTASATLDVDDVAKPFVRIFRQTAEGWAPVDLGSAVTTGLTLSGDELHSHVAFGIEGLDFVRSKTQDWQGVVTLTLTVRDGQKTLGTDVAQMRAAPWLVNHNLRPFDRVYYSDFSSRLVTSMPDPLAEAKIAIQTYPDNYNGGWEDIWYEDFFQTGWTAMPATDGDVHGMIIFNPRPWGRDPGQVPVKFLREHLLGPDQGVAVFFDEKTELDQGTTYDSHGNHEALPPYPGAPVGRILHGSGVLQSTQNFYEAQEVQPPITIDTSWLSVGHVDEIYASVRASSPKGFKLLENSPALGRQIFQDWEQQGHGDAVVFEGLSDFDGKNWQTTLAEIDARADLQAWNQEAQAHIDSVHDSLLADAGLAEDDFVTIPVLYEEIDGGKIAYLPDSANIRVVDRGQMAIMAKTFGPVVNGEDWLRKYHESRLTDPKLGLGADGKGLTVRFADSWDYHVLMGDVHCATNWSALPTKDEPRWWEAAK